MQIKPSTSVEYNGESKAFSIPIVKMHKEKDGIFELHMHLKQFKKLCKKGVDFCRDGW